MEQLKGQPRIESDQYSLAVVIYEWLAGRSPFRGTWVEIVAQHASEPPPSLVRQVMSLPAGVEAVLFKALAKHPKDRFPSVRMFVEALQQTSAQPTLSEPFNKSLPEEVLSKTPQPTLPLVREDSPTVLPFSMAQKPLTQPVEAAGERARSLPATSSVPPNIPTMPPVQDPAVLPLRKRSLS